MIATLLNLFAIASMGLMVILLLLFLFGHRCIKKIQSYPAQQQIQLLWLLALSPWLIGFVAGGIALSQDLVYRFHWHQGWHLSNWQATLALLSTTILLLLIVKALFLASMHYRRSRLLTQISERREDGVFELNANQATAFTQGLILPRSFISRGLLRQLSQTETDIVLLHEFSHVHHLSPFKKSLFRLCVSIFPPNQASLLRRDMALAMECYADTQVAKIIEDKSMIAMTLIKLGRIGLRECANLPGCNLDTSSLENRIKQLLYPPRSHPFVGLVGVTIVLMLIASATLFVPALYHLLEFFLHH